MGSLSATLPPADSPSLILTTATPDEAVQCQKINASSWKGPLTELQYLRREELLAQQELTKDGGLTCWILVDRTQQPDERTILSSCETLRKTGLLATKSRATNGKNGTAVRSITVHGVGSVFCREEFRGRKYASRMIQELGKALVGWQQPGVSDQKELFSILYSDIGKKFYAQHGFQPAESAHISLPPITRAEYDKRRRALRLPTATELEAKDLESICQSDVDHVSEKLAKQALHTNVPVVSIAPDYQHMAWHHAREDYLVHVLLKRYPCVKGARIDEDGYAGSFCIWTRTFGTPPDGNVLHFLRLSNGEVFDGTSTAQAWAAAAALLLRAQLEASEWNMESVELWNPDDITVIAAQNIMPDASASVVEREEHSIASIKWNGNEQGLGESFRWSQNEKYAWC